MNTKTKSVEPNSKHVAFRKALEHAVAGAGAILQAEEILAITAHFVGQLMALQDQRRYTRQMVLDLVSENIQQGNTEVVDALLNETGGNT